MNGFSVSEEELRAYAGKLSGETATVDEVKGLVSTADVGDQSWGIVGLFVKDEYSQLLGDLNDLLVDMRNGYQSGADKFNRAAEGYQAAEDRIQQLLNGFKVKIEDVGAPQV
jgi:hypothetical protein